MDTVVVSFSAGKPRTSRALNFECEDVLLETTPTASRLACVAPTPAASRLDKIKRRIDKSLRRGLPGEAPRGAIDLLIVNCRSVPDLQSVPGLRDLLRRAERSVCCLTEIWSHTVSRKMASTLTPFDTLAVGCAASAAPLAEMTKRPVHYLPPAVDALAWSAPRQSPSRVIDVLLFGRKHTPWHEALAADSNERGYFYWFDTVHAREPICITEHRAKFRELNQRSKVNIVNIAKVNYGDNRGADEEIGYRFFEAAAAGCALVGYRPSTPQWSDLFGWPDSIIEAPLDDPPRLVEAVHGLLGDPDRLARISRRNRAECLLRHDAVYRWEELFSAVGVEIPPGMLERKRRLADAAESLRALEEPRVDAAAASTRGPQLETERRV